MSAINVILRILLAFALVWGVLRALGKKEMGKLTYYNMATATAIGTLAGGLITDTRTNPLVYISGIVGFPLLTFLMGYISLKSVKAREIFQGKPTMVISNGQILDDNLKNMRLTTDSLLAKLRNKDVFNVSDVEFAVMEPEGKMSVLLKSNNQPVTPKDMNLTIPSSGMPTTIIKDGRLIEQNLTNTSLTKSWVKHQLKRQNISSIDQVFLCQVDSSGNMYVDLIDH